MKIALDSLLSLLSNFSYPFNEVGSPPKYIAQVGRSQITALPLPNSTFWLDRVSLDTETAEIPNLRGILTGIWDIVGTAEAKTSSQYFDFVTELIEKGETKVTVGKSVVTMFQMIGNSACLLTIVTI